MSVCEDCGFENEEDRLFCGACGEPLKGDAKLRRDTERLNKQKEEEAKAKEEDKNKQKPLEGRKNNEGDYEFKRRQPKKADYTDFWLMTLAMLAFMVLVACGWYLLRYYLL